MALGRKARGLDDLEAPPAAASSKRQGPPKGGEAPAPPKKEKATEVKPLDAAGYLAIARGMKDVDEDDYAIASDPLAFLGDVTEWIPTGSLAVDRLLGGGYPLGRVIEIAAWEQVGKSTLLDQSIAMVQSLGDVCVLIDSEQARDTKYSKRLGVDLDSLIVCKAETIEEAFIGMDRMLAIQEAQIVRLEKAAEELRKRKRIEEADALRVPRLFMVWDSLAGTPTEAERKGAADDAHVAEAAKIVRLNMRRLASRIANARAVLVFANQFYENIGGYGGLKSYGGSGVRYATSVRLWLSRKNALKVGDTVVGHIVEAKLKKTKVAMPKPPSELGLIYGAGIHNAWTLWEWGKKNGVPGIPGHTWVKQAGGWSYLMFPDGKTYEHFQGTFLPFADLLVKHPAVYEAMVAGYMAEQVVGGVED
jgi:RecA/RadA recombinase